MRFEAPPLNCRAPGFDCAFKVPSFVFVETARLCLPAVQAHWIRGGDADFRMGSSKTSASSSKKPVLLQVGVAP